MSEVEIKLTLDPLVVRQTYIYVLVSSKSFWHVLTLPFDPKV